MRVDEFSEASNHNSSNNEEEVEGCGCRLQAGTFMGSKLR